MFSTSPSTGTSTRCHIASAFSTSMTDTSCGVVTMTAPVMGSSCESESCASPVPDDGAAALDEEPDRDDVHAVVNGGHDLVAGLDPRWLLGRAHHLRDGRAVDV